MTKLSKAMENLVMITVLVKLEPKYIDNFIYFGVLKHHPGYKKINLSIMKGYR